jgi:hypothetical protein
MSHNWQENVLIGWDGVRSRSRRVGGDDPRTRPDSTQRVLEIADNTGTMPSTGHHTKLSKRVKLQITNGSLQE